MTYYIYNDKLSKRNYNHTILATGYFQSDYESRSLKTMDAARKRGGGEKYEWKKMKKKKNDISR